MCVCERERESACVEERNRVVCVRERALCAPLSAVAPAFRERERACVRELVCVRANASVCVRERARASVYERDKGSCAPLLAVAPGRSVCV